MSFGCEAGGNPASASFDADAHRAGLAELESLGVTWAHVGVPGDSIEHAVETLERYGEEVIARSLRFLRQLGTGIARLELQRTLSVHAKKRDLITLGTAAMLEIGSNRSLASKQCRLVVAQFDVGGGHVVFELLDVARPQSSRIRWSSSRP